MPEVLLFFLIIVARVVDVSLSTIRMILVVKGRGGLALFIGFFEILVWIFVVASVVSSALEKPHLAVAYALGFSRGTYVGVQIEKRLALGRHVIRIISRHGSDLATALRADGFRVTQFEGYGRDGPVQELFVETQRRDVPRVIKTARAADERCYYVIQEARLASSDIPVQYKPPRWWLFRFKR